LLQAGKNEFRQPFERQDLQTRVPLQRRIGQELPFQLESGLFWRQQNQRQPLRIFEERAADFFQAQECFPRASRTEQKSRLHPTFVAQKSGTVKEEGGAGAGADSFFIAKAGLLCHKNQDMISVKSLSKTYGAQVAVNELSFEVPAGQILGFLGPNGAGKSTTLKMLTGMLEPTSGTAAICGFDLRQQALEVKRHVGFVPESGAVFESLTGLEYLEMVAALYAIPEAPARERIKQFIAFFDLSFETLTDKLLGAYSKGMRRKVVITSALLHNPPVVFFDEPLDGLDANAAVGFKALIQTLAKEGKTIVYSSHILDVVERVCDRVIIIDKGRLLVDGRPEELVASHGSGTLEQLFTQLTGGTELQRRAEDFAKTFRP
jgi:ABC-2 type transport system ATP-binding protein